MAGQSSHQASIPVNIFSQGQVRDQGLEMLMERHSIAPTSPMDHQTGDSRDEGRASFSSGDRSNHAGGLPPFPSTSSQHYAQTNGDSTNDRHSERSDSDTEMADARSNFDGESSAVLRPHHQPVQPDPTPDDVLASIPNLFRLLDLVDEHGSGGIVEKIVIDQHSLHRLLNIVRPGSYDSVSRINFKELDKLSIKPTGLYGSQSEIIRYLQQAQYLDDNSVALLSRVNKSSNSSPALRSGLYLALHPDHNYLGQPKLAYIIYWPEDTTWDDQAASSSVRRNRVTFMR
ncbi:hypothetical protein FRC11_007234, partial [Ceratobasidium sp. 423]